MALYAHEKEQLGKLDLPDVAETVRMLDRFMERSGLVQEEVALKIGYSRSAISVLKSGSYNNTAKKPHADEASSMKLRAAIKNMIDEFDGAEDEGRSRHCGKPYADATYKQVRRAFYGAVDRGNAYCIDGAPGTRKSYLLKYFCRELRESDAAKNGHGRRAVYVYCPANVTPCRLLRLIATAAGLPSKGHADHLKRKIRFFLASRHCALVLDEVQHLTVDCVEIARELFDEPPYFGVIFAGSHDVQDLFNDLKLQQARDRLSNTIVMPGLTRDDVAAILEAEFGKKPPAAVVDEVVKGATRKDLRRSIEQRQPVTYISARLVWFAIDHMRENQKKGAIA